MPNRHGEHPRALLRIAGRGPSAEPEAGKSRDGKRRAADPLDLRAPAPRVRESGILLVECLIYLAVWFLITGLAITTFYRAWDNARSLARYTDDVASALKVGERWRAEVRQATGPLRLVQEPGIADQALHIPQPGGEVVYFYTSTNLLRRTGDQGDWTVLLPAVKASRMIADSRAAVTSWRWELELASSPKRQTRLRPLFTFQAVAATGAEP